MKLHIKSQPFSTAKQFFAQTFKLLSCTERRSHGLNAREALKNPRQVPDRIPTSLPPQTRVLDKEPQGRIVLPRSRTGVPQGFQGTQHVHSALSMGNLFRCLLVFLLASTSMEITTTRPAFGHTALYPHCIQHAPGDPFTCSITNHQENDPKGWVVCNYSTQSKVRVAHASYDSNSESWRSKGWWWIDNGTCKKIIGTYLNTGRRFLYAEGYGNDYRPTGAFWGSSGYNFCVNKNDNFIYSANSECSGSHVELKEFSSVIINSKYGYRTNLN